MKPFSPDSMPRPTVGTPRWLWAMPLLSCGFLGFIPPIVIATKVRTRQAALWAVGFAGAFLLGFALVGLQPEDTENLLTRLGVLLVVATGIGGACYGAIVGSKIDWSTTTPPLNMASGVVAVPPDPNEEAIAAVLAVRQKRAEARALAQRDPQMARDLRIGRPDLPRNYDDGGLIDVNSSPPETLAKWLGLPEAQAAHIADVRQQLGKFERPEDLLNLVQLRPDVYDQVSDRIILL